MHAHNFAQVWDEPYVKSQSWYNFRLAKMDRWLYEPCHTKESKNLISYKQYAIINKFYINIA